jgi:hypothetical protein
MESKSEINGLSSAASFTQFLNCQLAVHQRNRSIWRDWLVQSKMPINIMPEKSHLKLGEVLNEGTGCRGVGLGAVKT